jgi:phosphoglycolate phosphatase
MGEHVWPGGRGLRAVHFDFDGTLVDSYDAITASVNHVRSTRGLPPLPVAQVRRFVGRGPHYLFEHTVGPDGIGEALVQYRQHHPSVMFSGTRLLEGASDLLTALRRSGRKLALCSNKPRPFSEKILEHLQLADRFDAVLGPEDVTHPKPAPDMLVLALQKLGVSAAEALYVGDMTVDIETARGAGVPVWIVPTGSQDEETLRGAAPDRLCRDLNEVASCLPLG